MLQMKEGESVNSYCARTLKIFKGMKVVRKSMQESIIIAKILLIYDSPIQLCGVLQY